MNFWGKLHGSNSKVTLTIYDFIDNTNYDEKKLEFYPSSVSQTVEEDNTVTTTIPEEDDEYGFGYYVFKINGNEQSSQKYSIMKWEIKRETKENKVNLIFYSALIDLAETPTICSYSLESSNYQKEVDLNFAQRKDMGAYKIIDKTSSNEYDFDIYTVGGDVSFTVDGDMVYDFQKALEENIVTINDILEQTKMDEKYGICEGDMYQDGGTMEYLYPEYTIVKYNTLDGNQDFVIGPAGHIRNQVDEILYE